MEDEKLIKLQHFFSVDVRIKKEIYDIAPQSLGEYTDEISSHPILIVSIF